MKKILLCIKAITLHFIKNVTLHVYLFYFDRINSASLSKIYLFQKTLIMVMFPNFRQGL